MGYAVLTALIAVWALMSSTVDTTFVTQSHYQIDHWDTDDGLPVNAVNAIERDGEGYLWLATFDGLVRYDGVEFVVHNSVTDPGLPGNRFTNLLWAQGALWIETETRQLVRRDDRGLFHTLNERHGLPHAAVNGVYSISDTVYVATFSGVARFMGNDRFEPVSDAFDYETLSLAPFPGGGVAAGTKNHGLFLLRPGLPPEAIDIGGLKKIVSLESVNGQLGFAASGGFGVVTADGVQGLRFVDNDPMDGTRIGTLDGEIHVFADPDHYAWRDGRWQPAGFIDMRQIDSGSVMARGPRGHRWINRLSSLERSGEIVFSSDARINDFLVDEYGHGWIATGDRGLFRVRERPILAIGVADGLTEPNVYALHEHDGRLIVGTSATAAYTVDIDGPAPMVNEVAAPGGHFAFLTDQSGALWRAGGEICRGRPLPCVSEPGLESIRNDQFIRVLLQTRDGEIWAGAEQDVAVRSPKGGWQFRERPTGSVVPGYRTGIQTDDGRVWLGSNGEGVRIWHGGKLEQHITTRTGLSSDRIRNLYDDESHASVWVATEDAGACRIRSWASSSPEISCVGPDQGLWSSGVHRIIPDDSGRLWMSSNQGIFWVDQASLHAVADGEDDWIVGMAYGESDGMPDAEANGGMHSAGIRSASGWMWFPTQAGLAGFHPSQMPMPHDATVTIDNIVYANQTVVASDRFTLAPNDRSMEIRFSAPVLDNARRVRYRYRMLGLDDQWVNARGRRFVRFAALPPGELTFEVEASRTDGAWSGHRARMDLYATPRLYEQLWFRIAVAVLVVGIIAWVMHRRLHQAARRQRELEEAVDDRTAELSRALDQIVDQKREIEEQAKARSRLFGSISHELRTPLTLILGPLEEREKRRRAVTAADESMILRNARRLRRMVDQILDLERLESGQLKLAMETVNFGNLVSTVAEPFALLASQKEIRWDVSVTRECFVQADREQMEKVLSNLMSNALKYTPTGGSVRISCKRRGELLHIAVDDSGPGIPHDSRDEALRRFSRLRRDSAEPGTGIGLSLVQEIVELHSGTVEIGDSDDLGGAQIMVRLPTAEAPSVATGNSTVDQGTVLVIDDNADLRAYLQSILAGSYRVLQAEDGREGLQMARESLPDAIITDVMMPDLDGMEMVRQLRDGGDEACIPVLFLTARGTPPDEIAALAAGGDQYLSKPFDSAVLIARVEAMISSRMRFAEVANAPPLAGNHEPLVQRIQDYVVQHLQDTDLSVDGMARDLGYSRSSLFRKVKEATGISPNQFIRQARLQVASHWLTSEDATISEIAYAAGFDSLSSFSRVFRKEHGVTPSEYRDSRSSEGLSPAGTGDRQ